jgi:hypothetical protein
VKKGYPPHLGSHSLGYLFHSVTDADHTPGSLSAGVEVAISRGIIDVYPFSSLDGDILMQQIPVENVIVVTGLQRFPPSFFTKAPVPLQ